MPSVEVNLNYLDIYILVIAYLYNNLGCCRSFCNVLKGNIISSKIIAVAFLLDAKERVKIKKKKLKLSL
jgi:hypothetical protein